MVQRKKKKKDETIQENANVRKISAPKHADSTGKIRLKKPDFFLCSLCLNKTLNSIYDGFYDIYFYLMHL